MVTRRRRKREEPSHTGSASETATDGQKEDGSSDGSSETFLPRYSFLVLFVSALVMRFGGVANSWWLLHPEEIYSTWEVAHREVYGYGLAVEDNSTACPHSLISVRVAMEVLRLQKYLDISGSPFQTEDEIDEDTLAKEYPCRGRDSKQEPIDDKIFLRFVTAAISMLSPVATFFLMNFNNPTDTDASILATALVAFSFPLVAFSTNSLQSPVTLSLALFLLVFVLPPHPHSQSKNMFSELFTTFQKELSLLSGICLGVVMYLCSFEQALLVFFLVVYHTATHASTIHCLRQCVAGFIGFASGILFGGYYDFVCFGKWFHSVLCQQVSLVLNSKSAITDSLYYYFGNGFFYQPTVCFLTLLPVCYLIVHFCSGENVKTERNTSTMKVMVGYCLAAILVIFHAVCFKTKQEIRNVHDGIMMSLCASGCAASMLIHIVISVLSQNASPERSRAVKFTIKALIYGELVLQAMDVKQSLPQYPSASAVSEWTSNAQLNVTTDVNQCMHYAGMMLQNGSRALFLDFPLLRTGGFSLIHKNVPVLAKFGNAYLELDFLASYAQSKNHVTNYFELQNIGGVLQYLAAEDSPYDVAVLVQDTDKFGPTRWNALKSAYKMVHQCKTVIVGYRIKSQRIRQLFRQNAESFSASPYAVREAEQLFHLNLHSLALDRLKSANVDSPHAQKLMEKLEALSIIDGD